MSASCSVVAGLERLPVFSELNRASIARVAAALKAEAFRPGETPCVEGSPGDGMFIIERVADGRVVLAAGDSGEGFKFSALMGPLLADLVEGRPIDEDIATFGLARFAGGGERGGPAAG